MVVEVAGLDGGRFFKQCRGPGKVPTLPLGDLLHRHIPFWTLVVEKRGAFENHLRLLDAHLKEPGAAIGNGVAVARATRIPSIADVGLGEGEHGR